MKNTWKTQHYGSHMIIQSTASNNKCDLPFFTSSPGALSELPSTYMNPQLGFCTSSKNSIPPRSNSSFSPIMLLLQGWPTPVHDPTSHPNTCGGFKDAHKFFNFLPPRVGVQLLPLTPSSPVWLPRWTRCSPSGAAWLLRLGQPRLAAPASFSWYIHGEPSAWTWRVQSLWCCMERDHVQTDAPEATLFSRPQLCAYSQAQVQDKCMKKIWDDPSYHLIVAS